MCGFTFEPNNYPTTPGCYLMRGAGDTVLYVGKARNLRQRLRSYFSRAPDTPRHGDLVAEIRAIEVILVNTEAESLILENNLIKRYRPKYNRALMRDDTGYTYIRLTGEALPRFVVSRKNGSNTALAEAPEQPGSRRFGPYVSARYRDILLEFVNEHFQIRTCDPLPRKVCLRYHLGMCGGVCEGQVSPEEYQEAVSRAVAFLSHKPQALIAALQREMSESADRLEFERAARIKRLIAALEVTLEQQIVETDVAYDQDVLYFGPSKVLIARVERGMICGLNLFDLDLTAGYAAACREFLLSRYTRGEAAPPTVQELITNEIAHACGAGEALASALGRKIRLTVPQRGVKLRLLQLCKQNYDYRVSLTSSSPAPPSREPAARIFRAPWPQNAGSLTAPPWTPAPRGERGTGSSTSPPASAVWPRSPARAGGPTREVRSAVGPKQAGQVTGQFASRRDGRE